MCIFDRLSMNDVGHQVEKGMCFCINDGIVVIFEWTRSAMLGHEKS